MYLQIFEHEYPSILFQELYFPDYKQMSAQ